MRYLMAIILGAFLVTPAVAGFQGPVAGGQGGYQGQAAGMTAKEAMSLPDDAHVTLTGNLVRQLPTDHEKYVFRDATGEIVVEIDDDDFHGQTVTPQNTVRIYGEVDREFGRKTQIDVKTIEVLK